MQSMESSVSTFGGGTFMINFADCRIEYNHLRINRTSAHTTSSHRTMPQVTFSSLLPCTVSGNSGECCVMWRSRVWCSATCCQGTHTHAGTFESWVWDLGGHIHRVLGEVEREVAILWHSAVDRRVVWVDPWVDSVEAVDGHCTIPDNATA